MTTHDAYCIGKYWLKGNFREDIQSRSECTHCGVVESMDHILTQCESPGQKVIWDLAERLWEKNNLGWRRPLTGNIICCSLTEFKTEDGKHILGANCLWRILVSESAHLIWKLRCKRVIRNENTPFTEEEIRNRWYKMLDIHLETDCYMTKPSYEKKRCENQDSNPKVDGYPQERGLSPQKLDRDKWGFSG